MRDAFGGVFMFRLMLVFIVIYVAFTAISFKYAKSFRVKNSVIDFVEINQIIDIGKFFNGGNGEKMAAFDNILNAAEYDINCESIGQKEGAIIDKDKKETIGYCHNGVIILKNSQKTTDKTIYYNVYTYVNWELGELNTILMLGGKNRDSEDVISGRWSITGEAVVAH